MVDEDLNVELPGTALTVTELNNDISTVIENARNNELAFDFLIGDVSNDSESNGTRYFQLVNEDTGIQCLAFSSTRKSLPEFEEGDRVAVKGRLTFYEARGNCSLYVDDVILIGDSHYHRKIEQLRKNLTEEGLFEQSRKQTLPQYPSSIGIVTSKGSDAEEDAINAIQSRYPGVNIHLHHSRVQGIAALEDLCNAITAMDALKHIDVIVVTRGGGSEQDLHSFNTEGVARTIAAADTPVVTAIGHENDRPIVDEVSDDRAMTPTDVGEIVVPSKAALDETVTEHSTRLHRAYTSTITDSITQLHTDLTDSYKNTVMQKLTVLSNNLSSTYQTTVSTQFTTLQNNLETSHTVFKQEQQHQRETEHLATRQKQYKIALITLLIVLIALLVWNYI